MTDTVTAHEIVITRVFAAPREQVWAAWTTPEQLARWWGKRGWRTPPESVTVDARPGGVFRLNSISEADGREMPMDARFREVVEPERLVHRRARRRRLGAPRSPSPISATGAPRWSSGPSSR